MMMPANFSAISENEMTYVNGGASLADILAPVSYTHLTLPTICSV